MSSSVGGFIHFHWINTRSAWQDLEYHRQMRAQNVQQDLDNMDAANNAFATAQQNSISTGSNNAAQAALTRLQATAKSQSDAETAQITSAQSLLTQTQTASSTATTAATTSAASTSSWVDTIA